MPTTTLRLRNLVEPLFRRQRRRRRRASEGWRISAVVFGAALAVAALIVPCGRSAAQAPLNAPVDNGEEDNDGAIRLAEMRDLAGACKASTGSDTRKELVLSPEPILRFSDPTRVASDGTIWVWCDNELPVALVTVECYPDFWSHELVSMTAGRLVVGRPDGLQWRPGEPGIDLQPMPDAGAPAENKSGRLRQMRDMARQFALSETYRENTYELRLLPNPIHRFSSADEGIVDGALFVYSYGTNPEAILMIEGRRPAEGNATWSFGFVRLTAAEVRAKLGEKTVWTQISQLQTAHDAPYTHFRLSKAFKGK